MKKYIPKKGDSVRTIKSVSSSATGEGRVGIIERINNIGEIWVDFVDGAGGLYKKVIPHTKVNFGVIKNILLEYKASEISLTKAFILLEKFIFTYK